MSAWNQIHKRTPKLTWARCTVVGTPKPNIQGPYYSAKPPKSFPHRPWRDGASSMRANSAACLLPTWKPRRRGKSPRRCWLYSYRLHSGLRGRIDPVSGSRIGPYLEREKHRSRCVKLVAAGKRNTFVKYCLLVLAANAWRTLTVGR